MPDTNSRANDNKNQNEDSGKLYIPAVPKTNPYEKDRMFRVCAYCRVSTDNEEQQSSYDLQIEHFKHLAEEHPNWELKRIFADEGISATSTKKREEFNEMIEECQNGKYDLIVTKSVSRFARNLVDCISLIRLLKVQSPPVGVFFETDNLYTLSENSELMISFLATFAQEESVKKKEAMEWSLTQRFKDGKLLTPAPLGYDRPVDAVGNYIPYAPLVINEKEAAIVRFIYDAFIANYSISDLVATLNDIGCETKMGNTKWSPGSIHYILTNERYCGDVLTWKTFTADLFEHKHRKNKQDKDQYLYKDHHEAIISVEKFELVQVLLENRKHRNFSGLPLLNVISEGAFRGFIPINHRWINDDPGIYYDISNSVAVKRKQQNIDKRTFSAFDLDGYQVVRNQFTQIRYEGPCITIGYKRMTFNMFCMKRFSNIGYIQLLLHPAERKIAIRPCQHYNTHSIKWRTDPGKPLYPKSLGCPHFSVALFGIMKWNPDYIYRIRGTWVERGDAQIITYNLENAVPTTLVETEGKNKRVELMPEEWEDDFGEGFYEHELENGTRCLVPESEWKLYADDIPAPGIEQYAVPEQIDLQKSIEELRRRNSSNNE